MKCLVLAGGSSDRLWPLSRREYPKQFMEIREGRSMFQETILRNIPFCDEFVILTNKRYENVVKGQLQAFQGVKYSVIFENEALKTAPPVIAVAHMCVLNEQLLIVSSECIIDGDYASSIAKVKEVALNNRMGIIVCEPTNNRTGYNFINKRGNVVSCSYKKGKHSLWDCGIMAVKAGVLLKILPAKTVENCNDIKIENGEIVSDSLINPANISKLIHTDKCDLVTATFNWTRITDISSYYEFLDKQTKNNLNTISHNCKDVEIVNTVERRLIVANKLKNVVIVNTRDAVFVSDKSSEADIKEIMQQYYPFKKPYFDIQPLRYQTWGMEETLYTTDLVTVTKLVIYPRASYKFKCDEGYVANFLIMSGAARLESEVDEIDYDADQNIAVSDNVDYRIINRGKDNLLLMYTLKNSNAIKSSYVRNDMLVKLAPAFKDNLWGGTKIRDVLHKNVGSMKVIAESWELSAHPNGEAHVDGGVFDGLSLMEYINSIGKDKLGWKAQGYEMFPVMIKFIDAKQNLSIQVHPADEYALSVEGEYGKNEMWHVLEADNDACLYIGFNKDVTAEELRKRIKDDTLMEVLNKVPVKKGDTYFLNAGTVHAIGAGCFICEIQQSSNVTYRLYDYGRKDKNGKKRELHIDKALDVLDMKATVPHEHHYGEAQVYSEYVKTVIGECKYFSVTQYYIDGECLLPITDMSFQSVVVIEGEGTISDGNVFKPCQFGDTFFIAAKDCVTLKGKMKVLIVNV